MAYSARGPNTSGLRSASLPSRGGTFRAAGRASFGKRNDMEFPVVDHEAFVHSAENKLLLRWFSEDSTAPPSDQGSVGFLRISGNDDARRQSTTQNAQGLRKAELIEASGQGQGRGSPKYTTETLKLWFDGVFGGQVLFREFLAALRSCPLLQALLCDLAGVYFGELERKEHARLFELGGLALPVERRAEVLRLERERAKALFELVCGQCTGGATMDWSAFHHFFSSRGLVLEVDAAVSQVVEVHEQSW